jgi:hypothetical protein
MSSDNVLERLFKVQATVNKLVLDGKRDPVMVTNILQAIINQSERPPCTWREQDGVIYFSVTSDGTTGPQWIERLKKNDFRISDWAKNVLRSSDFKPTSGVKTQIAVLKGTLFEDNDRITEKIRAIALNMYHLTDLNVNAEVACLIRQNFSDKDIEAMGLRQIVVMHKPINTVQPYLLSVHSSDGGRWLNAEPGALDYSSWSRTYGFAFFVL